MKIFRAYLQSDAGEITWAAWIEAADEAAASVRAREMCDQGTPRVELWTPAQRASDETLDLEAV
jgi:hypothetical protein